MERIFRKPKLLRSLTTLDAGEFERLAAALDAVWQAERAQRTFDGGKRRRKAGGGDKAKLATTREKLFFLLFYFKCYPLQEVMGTFFHLSQGQVSHWVGVLAPLVNTALGRELLLPARGPAELDQLLEENPELVLLIDGTERPIRRPKNKDDQKNDYSGKKKAHRKKNLLLTGRKKVVYLGPTSPGSMHDKKLADESGLTYPAGALLIGDSAFQGYQPAGITTWTPKKKPRKRDLFDTEKTRNRFFEQIAGGR